MKTFVIAEIGSNHNGNLGHALSLIKDADWAGASAAKFQLWTAEDITTKENYSAARRYELPLSWLLPLSTECALHNIEFMCTPFSVAAVEALDSYVKRWKIASYDVAKKDMVDAIVRTGKPIIVSNGRSATWRIRRAIPGAQVLLCTSQYPAPVSGALVGLHECNGFSDHTLSVTLPAIAVSLGATIIEKHFTRKRPDVGPDHAHSLTSVEFKQMVDNIKEAELALYGQPVPTPPRPDRLEWVLDDSTTPH